MKSIDEIERLLDETPVPSLVEGSHRQQLKERLLMEPLPIVHVEKKLGAFVLARMSPAVKAAAAILAAALLVGAGWAAEKIYEKLRFTQANVTLEKSVLEEWKLPDERTMTSSGTMVTVVNPEDLKAIETAQRHHEEMKELIAQRKYKLLKTYENEFTGETEYVYTFTFPDGTQSGTNFSMPLDDVTSWDDYQQKAQEQREHFHEQVNKAIAAGRFRLIDQDLILMHICMDNASRERVRVQRIPLPKGEEIALYHPYDVAADGEATTQPQSSWREHLQAIRDDKLELLEVETIPRYTYEVTCDDETKRIFRYGGGEPLKGSKSK